MIPCESSPVNATRRWLPAYLLLALIWGFSFYLIMIGLESFTPVGVAFLRIVFGMVTMLIISAVTRTPLPPRWSWKYLFVAAIVMNTVPWIMFGFGETRVSSALAGIINGATPVMTLLAILIAFPEERPTRQRIVGLLVGFVGVLVVIGIWNGMSSSSWVGVLALLVAITCYGISYPYVRRHLSGSRERSGDPTRKQISPIALATGLLIMATIQTAPIVAITGVTDAPVTSSSFFALLALGVLGSGIAYVLNFRVIALSDATTASTVTYLTPLVAVIVGAVLLQEKISWHEPVGAVLIVIGAATAQGILRPRKNFTAPS